MGRAETLAYSNVPPARSNSLPGGLSRELRVAALLALVHLPLGVLLYRFPSVSVLHPFAVFCAGLYLAMHRRYSLDLVTLTVAYLIGAEVLWRMSNATLLWEFGKYGSAAIMIVALIARGRFTVPKLPLVYGLALIPGCLLAVADLDTTDARASLSGTMSGPFLLTVSCWFFSHVRLTVPQVRRTLFAILIPLLSVACVTLFYTVTVENIQFTTESNLTTSGGFGPNQVSSMLGLGVLLSAYCVILFRSDLATKVVLGLLAVFFAAQSVMTFSRGGIYNAIGGLIVLILFHFRNPFEGVKRLLPIIALVLLFFWLVFPALNEFTGGKLLERFEERGASSRGRIFDNEVKMFLDNPVFGVGVGVSTAHDGHQRMPMAHTEFSRLVADHGSFGLIAMLCLGGLVAINLLRQRSTFGRSLVAGLSVWAFLLMLNAAMRLGAAPFILGFTCVTIVYRRGRTPIQHVPKPLTAPREPLERGQVGAV